MANCKWQTANGKLEMAKWKMEKVQFVNGKRQMVNERVTSSDCVDNVQRAILRPCGIKLCTYVANTRRFCIYKVKVHFLIIVNPNHLCNLLVRTHITPLVVVVHKQAICLYCTSNSINIPVAMIMEDESQSVG